MHSLSNLVQLNIYHLKQAQQLIERVSDQSFTYIEPPIFDSGIGDHLRHIFDHYSCFLDGLDEKCVDYDARSRDRKISTDRSYAASHCETLCQALTHVNSPALQLDVKIAGSAPSSDASLELSPWTKSNIERELQYLQAHTIHHYALISMILKIQGLDSDADFGVAPSTLQHRATQMASEAL